MTDAAKTNDTTPPRPRRLWLTIPLVLAALAILLVLGTWQVQRMYWKEALLHDMSERRYAAPVALPVIEEMAGRGGDIEYRTVTVAGSFDHARERHFFATHQGQTGFYIYTPLRLADGTGRYVFINRGFVPYEMKDPAKRLAGEVSGLVTVEGLARAKLPAKPSSMLPDNDIGGNIFFWKDLDTMISSTGLDAQKAVPFFIDASAAENPGGWPQGGVTLFDLPNNHLQYAITWYGLALALVFVAGFAYFRGAKGNRR